MNVTKNKKKIICVLFISIMILCFVFLYKNNFQHINKLDTVELKTSDKKTKKIFAIMVQKEDGSGYEESEIFPSGLELNASLSGCIDKFGNEIYDAIEYNVETTSLKLKSKGSSYCYLYFVRDIVPPTITINKIDNYYTSARLSILSNESGTYCVNTSNVIENTSNCVFEGDLLESEIITNNFLESNTYYVHVKDKFGNVTISSALDIEVSYQKVEYIETTCTQLIKTDYYPTAQTMLRLKFNGDTTGGTVFGGRNSEADGFLYFNYNNQVYLDYGSGSGYNRIYGGSVSSNVTYEFEIGNRYIKNMNTGVNVISGTTVNFNKKNFTADIANEFSGKIYYLQVYETSELVRNFIPVYRTSDNVIGMFDEVNKVFYTNAGTGTFGKGSNVS